MCEDRTSREASVEMDALVRLVEADKRKAKKGIRVSHWDAPNEFQGAQELAIAKELAKSVAEQGRAGVREIVLNADPNELPDCHAKLDGERIGIEVTELIEPRQQWSDWPLARFEERLAAIIAKKDEKAGALERAVGLSRLQQLWLVIATDEPLLVPRLIREYLATIRLPKPSRFDAVFVLGPYEPRNRDVKEGVEHEAVGESAQYRAIEVQWITE